jgi:hypothetical protein
MSSVQLLHYHAERAWAVDPSRLDARAWASRAPAPKPPSRHCLWLSVGDSWKRWWQAEGMPWRARYRYATPVAVPLAALIRVRTRAALQRFTREYGVQVQLGQARRGAGAGAAPTLTFIDWTRVVRENPAKRGLLLDVAALRGLPLEQVHADYSWAWTWDASSAVLWRATPYI